MEEPMRFDRLWKQLKTNLSDPDMRAKVLALAGGKAIGLILVLMAMRIYLAPALSAQAPAALRPPEINAINTADSICTSTACSPTPNTSFTGTTRRPTRS